MSSINRPPIQTSWPGHCFGCSQNNPKGLKLRFVPTENGCLSRCAVPNHFCGFDGIVHGGMTSLLLDEAAIWTIATQLEQLGLTVEFTVQFHQPAPTGAELFVEGVLDDHDAGKAFIRSTVHSADEELLAEARSTWVLTTLSKFSEMMEVPESALQQFFDALRTELHHSES